METKTENYRKFILIGIIVTALGITISNALMPNSAVGIVIIAVGGLFFIIGMGKKKEAEKKS